MLIRGRHKYVRVRSNDVGPSQYVMRWPIDPSQESTFGLQAPIELIRPRRARLRATAWSTASTLVGYESLILDEDSDLSPLVVAGQQRE